MPTDRAGMYASSSAATVLVTVRRWPMSNWSTGPCPRRRKTTTHELAPPLPSADSHRTVKPALQSQAGFFFGALAGRVSAGHREHAWHGRIKAQSRQRATPGGAGVNAPDIA